MAEILVGRGADRPPPTFTENDKFSGLKTAFSSANGGGGVVGNLKVLSEI